MWVDGLCVPKGAKNYDNAMKFINFLCRPDVAKMNFDEIYYCTPNKGAIELIGAEEPELLEDETLFPTDETVARCEFFHDISQDIQIYNRIWLAVKSAR